MYKACAIHSPYLTWAVYVCDIKKITNFMQQNGVGKVQSTTNSMYKQVQ